MEEGKAKVWIIGDPRDLFFNDVDEIKEPTEELTIDDLKIKGPSGVWDRLIIERPAEEILYYRKRHNG